MSQATKSNATNNRDSDFKENFIDLLEENNKNIQKVYREPFTLTINKDIDTVSNWINSTLFDNADQADKVAQTLGHINYRNDVDRYSDMLNEAGMSSEAADIQDKMHETLANRHVLKDVLQDIRKKQEGYKKSKKK